MNSFTATVADPAAGWVVGWVVGGGKKNEINAVPFGGHLFYDLFLQGGGMAPSAPRIRY